MQPLLIDGESLTLDNVHEVAFDRRRVQLATEAAAKMSRTREVVEKIVNQDQVVYGVSTGFGKLSDVHIGRDQITPLQHNLVRSPNAREDRFELLARVLAEAFQEYACSNDHGIGLLHQLRLRGILASAPEQSFTRA